MAAQTIFQLEARWKELDGRMWREEQALAGGLITRLERLELDKQRQASRKALEIEAGRLRRSPVAAEFAAAKAEFAALVEQAVQG